MLRLNAKQLRKKLQPVSGEQLSAEDIQQVSKEIKRNEIYIILDNVLDTYNIGSVFRLADAVSAKRVILCGGSATPPNPRIKKASINTTEWVDWQYFESTVEAIQSLKEEVEGLQVVAVELNEKSLPYDRYEYKLPIALVVGHETDGISQEVLDLCDGIVDLPMFGVNISLNVMVALGIVLFKVVSYTSLVSPTSFPHK